LDGLNGPGPLLNQTPVLELLTTLPLNEIVGEVEQSACPDPAFTTASCEIDIFTVSLTIGQAPLFVELNVKVTDPFVMSFAVIAYDVLTDVFDGEKPPVPLLVHMPVLVPPPINPEREIEPALEQIA
jgi:hypothetical protein